MKMPQIQIFDATKMPTKKSGAPFKFQFARAVAAWLSADVLAQK